MTQSPVVQPGRSATQSLFEFAGRPKVLIGTSVAFVACTTVGAAVLLFNSASTAPKVALETPAAPAAISAPAVVASQRQIVVADRWYEDPASAAAAKPVLGAAPSRDAWYLDHSAAQTGPAQVASTPRVADRWYEDTTTAAGIMPVFSAPPVRDAWYLDDRPTLPGQAFSEQGRDTWYLDGQRTPSVQASPKQRHLVVDAWYLDSANGGHGELPEGR